MKDSIIRQCDWVIWVAFCLMLVVRFLSMMVFYSVHVDTAASIGDVVVAYEANPVAQWVFGLSKWGFLLGNLIVPGLAMSTYYLFRYFAVRKKYNRMYLQFFVNFVFFTMLINVVNDLAVFIGKYYGG